MTDNTENSETLNNPEDFSDNLGNQETQEEVPDEPVLTFYKYDSDGFFLGTTWKQEENTTDIPFEYESGFWFFFDENSEWQKVKIPDSVSELDFDITLDDNSTNYQKTLVSIAQRIFAEYSGDEYRLVITDNHYKTVHISEEERQKDQYRIEIQQLKKQLSDTDYKAIKYAEVQLTEEEYSPIRLQRQSYRDRINELEALL